MSNGIQRLAAALVFIALFAACTPAATPEPPTAAPTATPTATTVPTATPSPTATRRPTVTPRPSATPKPTNTPRPTVDAPSGFKPLTGDGVTLWLPESYKGGSMSGKDRAVLIANMKGLGGDFARMAEQFENMAQNVLFFAYDPEMNPQGGLTNVNIVEIPVFSGVEPATLAELMASQLPKQFKGIKVGEVEPVNLPLYPAARFTAQMSVNQVTVKELLYIVTAANATYLVTYATSAAEFDDLLPVFEQSIETFSLEP